MNNGYIKVASGTHKVLVGDVKHNVESLLSVIECAQKQSVKVLVTPELGITGYTVGDLVYFDKLLSDSIDGVFAICKATKNVDMLIFVGMPLRKGGRIYNTSAVLYQGKILAFIPKTYLANYSEYYEKRHFCGAPSNNSTVLIKGIEYPFGKNIILRSLSLPEFCVACEIGEDLWVATPPSSLHALNGATIIANLSASSESVSKATYRQDTLKSHSSRLKAGYIYCNAGEGESTTDMVFSGHNIIAENGKILSESNLFDSGVITTEIDVKFLSFERSKHFHYQDSNNKDYLYIDFDMKCDKVALTRQYEKTPFVPTDIEELSSRAKLILTIQAMGLKKRLEHTKARGVVLGISGGLDSSLTILIAARAMKLLNRPMSDIIAVTMPCFGTTSRTLDNASKLSTSLGVTFKVINIEKSVLQHLSDIEHNALNTDTTYENAQARERTQVLMDIANQHNVLVLGTGDLSELALGWATFNGDHMSMYATNSTIPKTLIRHLVKYEAQNSTALQDILLDILDTPVSPELLPAKDGKISQKTEEIVGPYILHDFFLYHFIRMGFSAEKLLLVAKNTFNGDFDEETIKKWLKIFLERFFFHQFKRNCMPDGVKVGSVSLSPRSDWKMPSDAVPFYWDI